MWAVVFHPWMLTVSSLASCGLVVWLWGSWYVNFRLRLKIIYFFFHQCLKDVLFLWMDLLHLEINSKNITSMKSCQQFISSSGVTQSLASKLQHLQTHSHHSLTTCLCYGLWLAASSQTGDTHLTALSTIPAPAFGASVFLLVDIVFSSHRNLRLHCCKSPSLSLVLTFNIPSALFTPSSLPHLSHLFLIYSFFLHRSHPSHCCIMALERNLQCFPIIHVCPQDSLGSFKKKKTGRREGRAAVISSIGSALASFFFSSL